MNMKNIKENIHKNEEDWNQLQGRNREPKPKLKSLQKQVQEKQPNNNSMLGTKKRKEVSRIDR